MKKLIAILPILLLISCGDADLKTVTSTVHDYGETQALMTDLKLDSAVREIIVFSFPEAYEVENFEFTKKTTYDGSIVWDQTWWNDMFDLVPYGKSYKNEIPMNMDADLKVQDLVGKILTISNSRDHAWRKKHELLTQAKPILPEVAQKLNNEFPCFEVKKRGNPNKRKCYLKKIAGITKNKAKKWRFRSCSALLRGLKKYKGLKLEDNVTEDLRSEYFLSESNLKLLQEKGGICESLSLQIEKFVELRANGKLLVANMIGAAGEAIGAKLLAKGSSLQDVVGGGNNSEVEFDPKTMSFSKFQLAIDFKDQDNTTVYSEEAGNLTNLEVVNINGSGNWMVNFTIHTEDYRLETLGLSIALDEVFGLRMSGKTMLYYRDGTQRRGIMRIDLAIEE